MDLIHNLSRGYHLIWLPSLPAILFGLVIPLAVYCGRNNIRQRRRKIVQDLAAMFAFAKDDDGNPIIIPSLELIKYKYDPKAAKDLHGKNRDQQDEDARWWHYTLPVGLYVFLTSLFVTMCFRHLISVPIAPDFPSTSSLQLTPFMFGGDLSTPLQRAGLLANLCYTFLGAYVWTLYYLIKRVSNFDLSPLSFLRASAQLIFATFVSAAVWHTLDAFFGSTPAWNSHGPTAGLAFLIGWFPDLGFKYLVTKYPSMRLKRVKPETVALSEELPLDCIIGIDPFMKFRLAEFEIEDVQNLATINPIQLFVETSYGLYQVIDWVAQAQLVLAVGAPKTLQLRKLNVRTIFDLEKARHDPLLQLSMLKILIPDGKEPSINTNGQLVHDDGSMGRAAREQLRIVVDIIHDDLHVRRLRQIWDIIASLLENRPTRRTDIAGVESADNKERDDTPGANGSTLIGHAALS